MNSPKPILYVEDMPLITLEKRPVRCMSEIFQAIDIKFAFVNSKLKEVSAAAKCRDFLGDCIVSKLKKSQVSIFGFFYNYETTPYDNCRFSLMFPNEHTKETFIKNLPWLHEKETQAGVTLSKLYRTQYKDTLLIEGDDAWISNVWKVSLYTFYIKVCSYPSVEQLQEPENEYINSLTKKKECVILKTIKKQLKEHLPEGMGDCHNSLGWYSLLNLHTSSYYPWISKMYSQIFKGVGA